MTEETLNEIDINGNMTDEEKSSDEDVDIIEKAEIDENSRIEKEIEKTGVVIYEK